MKCVYIIAVIICMYPCVSSHSDIVEEGVTPTFQEFDQETVGRELRTHSSVFFVETFNDKENFQKTWIISKSKKKTDDGSTLQYDGDWLQEKPGKDPLPNDLGLTFKLKAKHRAISSKLFRDFKFGNRPLVIQYEVLHQDGQECGGAYLKLISKERPISDLNEFNDKTPYSIMFGPDKCGTTNKLHFIFRHMNPLNGTFEEKHCKPGQTRIDETFTDSKPHLFKLILNPDNSFSISVDHKVINEGSLLEHFEPPVNPPQVIDDPNDKKPADWDDREKIPDPNSKKPDDWDESAPPEIPDSNAVKPDGWLEDEPINISDPSAEKPDDWDDEMDGEWEAPLVPNPACEDAPGCGPWTPPLINNPDYKGKWTPPLISNPNFKGIWKPRKIPNPDFFEDKHPFQSMSTIDAVGFELWSVSSKVMFDNIIITDDDNVVKQFASVTFDKKIINIEKSAETLWSRIMVSLNHKPGWWSLYFLYCLFPIAVYVWYLWRRVKEDTLLNQFVAFTNRYPWLWAIYIVVLLIPITLIVVCCFWNSKDTDAEHKKNDDLNQESSVTEESSYSPIASPSSSPPQAQTNDQGENPNTKKTDEESRSSLPKTTDNENVQSGNVFEAEVHEEKKISQRRSEERSSEPKELPKSVESHSEEHTENDTAENTDQVSEHSSTEDKHSADEHSARESSGEPEMVLKKRK